MDRNQPAIDSSPAADAWPAPARAWAMVMLLVAAYAIAFVDRQILTLLVEPVKRDLAITDTQFSLLSGLAFTLFYTIMGIPFAWLADRGSRRNLIAVSMTFWSVMTAACGLANSFLTLFLARIGVGVGEAGLSPAAYSMIADSFPPEKRARPLTVYAIGAILGVGLALIIGGAVVHWASSAPPVVLPVIGELKTWQLAFLIVSLPGPLLALLLLPMREPTRHEKAKTVGGNPGVVPRVHEGARRGVLAAGHGLLADRRLDRGLPVVGTRVHDARARLEHRARRRGLRRHPARVQHVRHPDGRLVGGSPRGEGLQGRRAQGRGRRFGTGAAVRHRRAVRAHWGNGDGRHRRDVVRVRPGTGIARGRIPGRGAQSRAGTCHCAVPAGGQHHRVHGRARPASR